jgi:predicted ArsR family transcriptional regulator
MAGVMPRRAGRPEQPIDPGAPYADAALVLRQLKARSGLSYREIAVATGYPASVLADTARGHRMPRLDLLRAFVTACSGQEGDLKDEWDELTAQIRLPGQLRFSPNLEGAVPTTTRRELDVLISLCRLRLHGSASAVPATVGQIAADLGVTDAAVKQHLRKLYPKFNVPAGPHRRTRLANAVVASGLFSPMDNRGDNQPAPGRASRAYSDRERDWQRADALAQRGDPLGAALVLRARAEDGDGYAARLLAALLAEQGDLDGLQTRADHGDLDARLLVGLLADYGDTGSSDHVDKREMSSARHDAERSIV